LKSAVINCIANCLSIDPLKINQSMMLDEDLQIDEIDIVDIAIALEERFEIEISDNKIRGATTIQDLITVVELKLN